MTQVLTVEVVTKILRESWDPIGMGTMPDLPADEYASYAPKVIDIIERMRKTAADDGEKIGLQAALISVPHVASYLTWVRTSKMGLYSESACDRDANAAAIILTAAMRVGRDRSL